MVQAVGQLSVNFLASLSCLVPPPFVDLLFAHGEFVGVVCSHDFDAFSGPHHVSFELASENLDFSLGLSLPLSDDFVAGVTVFSIFFAGILVFVFLSDTFTIFQFCLWKA